MLSFPFSNSSLTCWWKFTHKKNPPDGHFWPQVHNLLGKLLRLVIFSLNQELYFCKKYKTYFWNIIWVWKELQVPFLLRLQKSSFYFSDSDVVLGWLVKNKHVFIKCLRLLKNLHHIVLKQRYVTVEITF